MKAFLLDIEDFEADKVAKHTDCMLGKWIYNEAIHVYKENQNFIALESTHQELHRVIVEIILAKKLDKIDEAQKKLSELDQLSGNILGLLDALEKDTLK
jgi:hypothetical protein